MSVVIFTVAELTVLSTMLGGLIHKRAHDRPVPRAARVPISN